MARLVLSCFLIRSTVSRELPGSSLDSAGLHTATESRRGSKTIIGLSVVVGLSGKHIVKPEDPVAAFDTKPLINHRRQKPDSRPGLLMQ